MTSVPETTPKLYHHRQAVIWLVALATGIIVGLLANAFRLLLFGAQSVFLGSAEVDLLATVGSLPWWQILCAPAAGGLVVGVGLTLLKEPRPGSIADVIEARHGPSGRLNPRRALANTGLSALSLGAGASAGREGPMVYLGASMASGLARALDLPPRYARILLGCGAAAAVSASFNAPLAGVLFALELILQNYALRSIAPVTIAAVAGTVITRAFFGADQISFMVPHVELVSYLEMPAFVALGVLSAVLAMVFIEAMRRTDRWLTAVPLPLWLRPVLGGFAVGGIALVFPQVLGVGYGTISDTLEQQFDLSMLLMLIGAKLVATTLTYASRFGGGVFSPSLLLGALCGGAFGLVLDSLFTSPVTSFVFYAMVGMGAVAAAVLGAPISTTLIVFELTGGYQITIALLVSASVATLVTQASLGYSLFQWQLAQRGLDLREGTYVSVLNTIRVRDFMVPVRGETRPPDSTRPAVVSDASLEKVLTLMEDNDLDVLDVVDRADTTRIIGSVTYKAALVAYKDALVQSNIEDHQ